MHAKQLLNCFPREFILKFQTTNTALFCYHKEPKEKIFSRHRILFLKEEKKRRTVRVFHKTKIPAAFWVSEIVLHLFFPSLATFFNSSNIFLLSLKWLLLLLLLALSWPRSKEVQATILSYFPWSS